MAADRLASLPIIGLCGGSGTGKTTLIEALIPRFLQQGLRTVVVKHGAHRIKVDVSGKDSDRFFCAGGDVALFGEEHFFRRHGTGDFLSILERLCLDYDLVLVEGHASTPVPKLWLLGENHSAPPENSGNILHIINPHERQVGPVFDWIMRWLHDQCLQVPVFGCILFGGKSRRMGRPKHLIEQDGLTWMERTVAKLQPHVQTVVLSGSGDVPSSLIHLPCIPDIPGLAGPLSGLLSILRWQPMVSWIMVACDQPDIESRAISWLQEQRSPGIRAVLPDLNGDGHLEPLLAWYDYRCIRPVEALAAQGSLRLSDLARWPGVVTPRPHASLQGSWHNVNTPAELGQMSLRVDEV